MKKRTIIGIVILLVALAGIGGSLFAYDQYKTHENYENTKYINVVQGTSMGDSTIKTILNKVLYDPKWEQVTMTDNSNAVEVTGSKNNHKLVIDFEVTNNNGNISFDGKKNKIYAFEDGNSISYTYLIMILDHYYIDSTGDKLSDKISNDEKQLFGIYSLTYKLDPEFKQYDFDSDYVSNYYENHCHRLALNIVQAIQDGTITKSDLSSISEFMDDSSATVDCLTNDEETEDDRNTIINNFDTMFSEIGKGINQIK